MITFFTHTFNNPSYLEYQYKCIKHFVTDEEDISFVCINNANDLNTREYIRQICHNLNIPCHVNMAPNHIDAGTSHYSSLQWAYDTFIKNTGGLAVMLDHDIFPYKYVSIRELLDGHDIAGINQSRAHVHYLHPTLVIMDMDKLPNKNNISFYGGCIDGHWVDIGGELYYYFKKNPNVRIKHLFGPAVSYDNNNVSDFIPEQYLDVYDAVITKQDLHMRCEFQIIENKFFHIRVGSNWIHMNQEVFAKRNKLALDLLDYYINKK